MTLASYGALEIVGVVIINYQQNNAGTIHKVAC